MALLKAQAAVDFMVSYGMALIIIFIAVAVIYKVTFLTPVLATSTCTPSAAFECESFSLNVTGALNLRLSQATGGSINVKGVACSSQANITGNKPAYGNIYVTNSLSYYPPYNAPSFGGISVYSGGSGSFLLYCYQPGGGKATGILGNGYTGFVWLNYTVPGYGNVTELVATLNLRYT